MLLLFLITGLLLTGVAATLSKLVFDEWRIAKARAQSPSKYYPTDR